VHPKHRAGRDRRRFSYGNLAAPQPCHALGIWYHFTLIKVRTAGKRSRTARPPNLNQHVADVHVASFCSSVQWGTLILVLHFEVGIDSINCEQTVLLITSDMAMMHVHTLLTASNAHMGGIFKINSQPCCPSSFWASFTFSYAPGFGLPQAHEDADKGKPSFRKKLGVWEQGHEITDLNFFSGFFFLRQGLTM
jgi:hypothetical protein